MTPDRIFDLCRFNFLFTSLIIQHIIHDYLVYSLISRTLACLNYVIQFFSVLYLLLCFSRKGHVDYKSKGFLRLDYKPGTRYCRICNGYKPLRAHHCSRCNKCIKKMDHHCMWLSVCVNYDNHGDFIRFLFFSVLSMASSVYGFCLYIIRNYCTTLMKILFGYLFLYSLTVAVFCGVMLKLQIDLINRNVTYIEDQHYYVYDETSVYDRGLCNNWNEVMGSALMLWMCRPSGDGISYERNDGVEDDDINFV
ncbi:hypothetical protein P3W45_000508 [Vairimorpha bombi]